MKRIFLLLTSIAIIFSCTKPLLPDPGPQIDELRPITFTKSKEDLQYNYVAFGNLLYLTDNTYAWIGRVGNKHLGIGRIAIQKYNSQEGTFLPFISIPRRPVNPEVRGGSSCIVNGIIYYFTTLYNSANLTFLRLSLFKSTDGITGQSWSPEQPLLYTVGTNNGINETTFPAYNFYGTPENIPGTAIWFVPWYEIGAPWYKVNYLYTENNFQTWENRTLYEGTKYKATETAIEYIGNNTLIALSRQEADAPLLQSISLDLGVTWSEWETTNLGSSLSRSLPSMVYTPEYGLVVCYADRGTGTIKLSKNNDVNTIIANPTSYSTPEIIYTVGPADPRQPLGYPSIIRVSYKRYMIAFSEEVNAKQANLLIGDGALE